MNPKSLALGLGRREFTRATVFVLTVFSEGRERGRRKIRTLVNGSSRKKFETEKRD